MTTHRDATVEGAIHKHTRPKRMPKTFLSVGFQIPGHSDFYASYDSGQSLLDADIIIFAPSIPGSYRYGATAYQGKSCLEEGGSFRLKDAASRWKSDLSAALNEGKTVFLFLQSYEVVYVHSGQVTYSGTGRNSRRTNHVDLFNTLSCIPFRFPAAIAQKGSSVSFKSNSIFSVFWKEFAEHMEYECYFDGPIGEPIFTTKVGAKSLCGFVKVGKGHLVVLPRFDYDEEDFTETIEDGEDVWNKEGIQFGNRLIKVLVDIDGALRNLDEESPAPDWVDDQKYVLRPEILLRSEVAEISAKMETLALEVETLRGRLADIGLLRALVYEKGKRLEAAIIRALNILGFSAEEYDDGKVQLDQVISSPEGQRFIGEAEGKDTSAINIEKFRQLATNIQEDLEREDVTGPAKGILFGNPFRLTPPLERSEGFTAKCIANAERSGTALVSTADLFGVAKYVLESGDAAFAATVRSAIGSASGVAVLPEVPDTSPKDGSGPS